MPQSVKTVTRLVKSAKLNRLSKITRKHMIKWKFSISKRMTMLKFNNR